MTRKADIVYLVGGGEYGVASYLRTLNNVYTLLIYTVLDLCHRDHPEFPEVRNHGCYRSAKSCVNAC